MSFVRLKENNVLLKQLLDEFKTDPITENNTISDIIAAVTALVQSRDKMQVDYEKQKQIAEGLQGQLSNTFTDLKRCSAEDVPALNQRLSDLQTRFTTIYQELNVTNEIVAPLNEIVTKSREDLRKCVAKEKQLLATLQHKEVIAETAEKLVPQQKYEFENAVQNAKTMEGPSTLVTPRESLTDLKLPDFETPDTTVIGEDEFDDDNVPLMSLLDEFQPSNLTPEKLATMDKAALKEFAIVNKAPWALRGSFAEDLDALRDDVWDLKIVDALEDPLLTSEQIRKWSKSKILSFVRDPKNYSDREIEDARATFIKRHYVESLQRQVRSTKPDLYNQIMKATPEERLEYVRRFDQDYELIGETEEDRNDNLENRALEVANRFSPVQKF